VGFSGLLGVVGAVAQWAWIPEPAGRIPAYLTLWIGLAAIAAVVWGIETIVRCRRATMRLSRQKTLLAVELFFPCMVAGAVLTWAIVSFAPQSQWMLPGVWSVVFSLGIFASCRVLPKPVVWVGAYYLIAGAAALAFARGEAAFSPWAMVGTFGVGQSLAAAVLYFTLERNHAEE
jgi:hypothetical protein